MSYPTSLIRGIPNKDFMEDDFPNATLFNKFDENPERKDNYNEMSINWNDDNDALTVLFNQRKKGTDEVQFKIGGAIILKEELDKLCKKPQIEGKLKYERKEVNGNQYHGNLLLEKGTTKSKRNMIASFLALSVKKVEKRAANFETK